MTWPDPQDYNDSIQNLSLNLLDKDLKGGRLQIDRRGLPVVNCGNFGAVYKINSGRTTWAVKCFFHEYGDIHERYQAISDYLDNKGLPGGISLQFAQQGIRVGNDWYPILKMEWVNGELLHQYIARNISSPVALRRLAQQWHLLMHEMKNAGVAHGDLQNGNIIIADEKIKLIDYDGAFVPVLLGKTSHEVGHPNFQHPKRTVEFGPHLDNFSSWVIYLSLRVLSQDSRRWLNIKAYDEQLLFTKQDFTDPSRSQILQELLVHPDETIRSMARALESFLHLHPARVPPLEVPDHERIIPPPVPPDRVFNWVIGILVGVAATLLVFYMSGLIHQPNQNVDSGIISGRGPDDSADSAGTTSGSGSDPTAPEQSKDNQGTEPPSSGGNESTQTEAIPVPVQERPELPKVSHESQVRMKLDGLRGSIQRSFVSMSNSNQRVRETFKEIGYSDSDLSDFNAQVGPEQSFYNLSWQPGLPSGQRSDLTYNQTLRLTQELSRQRQSYNAARRQFQAALNQYNSLARSIGQSETAINCPPPICP